MKNRSLNAISISLENRAANCTKCTNNCKKSFVFQRISYIHEISLSTRIPKSGLLIVVKKVRKIAPRVIRRGYQYLTFLGSCFLIIRHKPSQKKREAAKMYIFHFSSE